MKSILFIQFFFDTFMTPKTEKKDFFPELSVANTYYEMKCTIQELICNFVSLKDALEEDGCMKLILSAAESGKIIHISAALSAFLCNQIVNISSLQTLDSISNRLRCSTETHASLDEMIEISSHNMKCISEFTIALSDGTKQIMNACSTPIANHYQIITHLLIVLEFLPSSNDLHVHRHHFYGSPLPGSGRGRFYRNLNFSDTVSSMKSPEPSQTPTEIQAIESTSDVVRATSHGSGVNSSHGSWCSSADGRISTSAAPAYINSQAFSTSRIQKVLGAVDSFRRPQSHPRLDCTLLSPTATSDSPSRLSSPSRSNAGSFQVSASAVRARSSPEWARTENDLRPLGNLPYLRASESSPGPGPHTHRPPSPRRRALSSPDSIGAGRPELSGRALGRNHWAIKDAFFTASNHFPSNGQTRPPPPGPSGPVHASSDSDEPPTRTLARCVEPLRPLRAEPRGDSRAPARPAVSPPEWPDRREAAAA